MSKVIRKLRLIKKKERTGSNYIVLQYPLFLETIKASVTDIVHKRGKCAPVAVCQIGDQQYNLAATEGLCVGTEFEIGSHAKIQMGNITHLRNIPEGSAVHSVENTLGDGGKFANTAGGFCLVVNHRKETNLTVIKLPSGEKKELDSNSRAIVGIVASAGVTEKPILKASTARCLRKARKQAFPKVRGVAMNPVDHPHGGGNQQHIGAPSTIGRRAPYPQQVGLIAARSTGRGRAGSKRNIK